MRTAEEVHVRLALENMLPGHLCADAASLRALLDDIASPHLGACFDTGHAHVNKEHVVSAFTALRERIIAFHLQDNDGNGDKHLQPPYGAIDWEAFRDELRSMAFAHPLAVEAAPWNGASWGVLLRELRALFSEGVLTVRVGDRSLKAVCPQCGRYCFGTREHWFCACG